MLYWNCGICVGLVFAKAVNDGANFKFVSDLDHGYEAQLFVKILMVVLNLSQILHDNYCTFCEIVFEVPPSLVRHNEHRRTK